MDILDKMNSKFGLDGLLKFVMRDELIFIEGENRFAKFALSLHGGHVTSYQPAGSPDILWVSEKSNFTENSPIRGGIPVCWPWFGAHPEDTDKPSHGFARIAEWSVVETSQLEPGDAISVTLELKSSCESRKIWPHDFVLRNRITFGTALEVELTTDNCGNEPFTVTAALHSYFNICDIRNVKITGLEGVSYIDTIDNDSKKLQEGAITFDGEVDRVYVDTDDTALISDPGFNRTVNVSKRGSRSTVVWNPWIAKSARMTDFGDEEYQKMLCVETTNALDDAVVVEPGDSHSLLTLIWLS